MVERGEGTHQLEIVWSAGLTLVEQQPRCHCLLSLGMVHDPGRELGAGALFVEHLWVPLQLKVNSMLRPRNLMTLSLSVKSIGLEMRWDQPDVLSMGWQKSGSVCQEAVRL